MKLRIMKKRFCALFSFILFISVFPLPQQATAEVSQKKQEQLRQHLFETMQTLTGLPWPFLAAMDQYEKNLHAQKEDASSRRITHICVPSHLWAGVMNPNPDDQSPFSIRMFHGIGRDGNGDGKADPENDSDVLYSIAHYLVEKGWSDAQIRERIWDYYQHPVAVDVITHIARIYQKFNTTWLTEKSFPIQLGYNYTYRSTWGARRSFGGLRIHEGTDIFADYGTPVLSTCYGYVELIGWNRYGGWRVGIRDLQNRYHYFAHLNGFKKGLKKGDIVKPGEVIGSVGSSGYGPPGTSGKFPPHLHYGIYKFNGRNTYSFDPYPLLKRWEREAYQKKRKLKFKRKRNHHRQTLEWVD